LRHHILTLSLPVITMSASEAKKPSTEDQLTDMRAVLEKLASAVATI
jgi:hypothetical protein